MRAWLFQKGKEALAPEIEGECCVHTLAEVASCQACVEVCPEGAWLLDEESLRLDVEACHGCGLCVAACPEGALKLEMPLLVGEVEGRKLVCMACAQGNVEGGGVIPCVHAVGTGELLRLYRQGVREIAIAQGTCASCRLRRGEGLEARVEGCNRALASRGLPRFSMHVLDADTWRRLRDRLQPEASLTRRAFFKAVVAQALVREEGWRPPGSWLPGDGIYPFLPVFDAALCEGCDACTRTCPHGAIAILETEEGEVYRVEAALCTGCELCVDICHMSALRIEAWARPALKEVRLRSRRCRACGVSFHLPEENPLDGTLCPICQKINHPKKLFQVYTG